MDIDKRLKEKNLTEAQEYTFYKDTRIKRLKAKSYKIYDSKMSEIEDKLEEMRIKSLEDF